jgi:hypothetical protein
MNPQRRPRNAIYVTTFAVFHGFEADLPGRCKVSGISNIQSLFFFLILFFIDYPNLFFFFFFFFPSTAALWKYPGAALNRQALLELMHLEAEGLLHKHFSKFTTHLEDTHPNFWVRLNEETKAYFGFACTQGESFGRFSCVSSLVHSITHQLSIF